MSGPIDRANYRVSDASYFAMGICGVVGGVLFRTAARAITIRSIDMNVSTFATAFFFPAVICGASGVIGQRYVDNLCVKAYRTHYTCHTNGNIARDREDILLFIQGVLPALLTCALAQTRQNNFEPVANLIGGVIGSFIAAHKFKASPLPMMYSVRQE